MIAEEITGKRHEICHFPRFCAVRITIPGTAGTKSAADPGGR